jgi:hypothetical protein
MGFAVARAAEHRGAEVTLISGPTHLADPMNVTTIRVRTAEEMAGHVFQQMENADVIIKSAAVSDYGPKESEAHKIKKGKNELVLHLQQNEDILKVLGQKSIRFWWDLQPKPKIWKKTPPKNWLKKTLISLRAIWWGRRIPDLSPIPTRLRFSLKTAPPNHYPQWKNWRSPTYCLIGLPPRCCALQKLRKAQKTSNNGSQWHQVLK